MPSPSITIVVPVYNEDESLRELVAEIQSVSQAQNYEYQIVFVDDGSTDRSWREITSLAEQNPQIGGIRFRRNFGKAAALMAGFSFASGEIVFMMDADLQDPPQEMPRLLEKLNQGYGLVSGWKEKRHDPWHKVYPSHLFNRAIGWVTGVHLHDHVCGLKVMRGDVARSIRIYGEFHRFIGVFAAWRGYRVTEIPTLHRARTHGVSKYGVSRFFKGFLDLITIGFLGKYRWRPQHIIGMTGLAISLYFFVTALLSPLPGFPMVFCWNIGLIALPAILLIALGLVTQFMLERRPLEGLYDIAEKTGWCAASTPSHAGNLVNGGEIT